MRRVVPIHRSQGMPKEEALNLIKQGWGVYSNVSIRMTGNIVTLDNQAVNQVETFDIWCSPSQRMIPELGMAYLLIDVAKSGGHPETIQAIMAPIFGEDMTVETLEKRVPPRDPQPPTPPQEAP